MGKSRRRKARASDPGSTHFQQTLAKVRHTHQRCRDLAAGRDPGEWGIDREATRLASNRDVHTVADPHRRAVLVHARRVDVFEAISLSADQHRAADRYQKDWNERAGVQVEPRPTLVVDASPGLAPGQLVTQRMIDAGRRVEEAHAEAGRAAARLLAALVEPLVLQGRLRAWREVVEEVTGEADRHAQAARVRAACDALHAAYEDIDRRKATARNARRLAGGGEAC